MEDSTASRLEDSAASRLVVDLTTRPPDKQLKSDDTKLVNSPITSMDHNPSIGTVTNENKMKKKLDFSDGTIPTSSPSVSTADGTVENTAAANIKLVETLLNTSTCNVLEVSSDNEFNVLCMGTSGSHDWPFNPITESSREELGPLVQITKFGPYPNYVTGGRCKQGKIPVRERIRGDGNCYFHCISFILSGAEDFYPEVRKAICDFIEVFDTDLSPFLNEGEGKKYIQDSGMRNNTIWATEMEILARAKIMRCDVFTFHNYEWQRFPYKGKLSHDAFYIDHRVGNHYDVVLQP